MEDNINDIMEAISNIGRIFLYIFIGIAVFFIKRAQDKQRRGKTSKLPDAESEIVKPITEPPKPVLKHQKRASAAATERKYFTYENEADYASRSSERKEKTIEQRIDDEHKGSAVDFDLRAAVIASEILKPKFEE